jgi:hypothetical protein
MSRKKRSLIVLGLILLGLVVILVGIHFNSQTSTANNSNNTSPTNDADGHKGKVLVTPEFPFGTIGSVTAVAAAFGILAVFKRRKQ